MKNIAIAIADDDNLIAGLLKNFLNDSKGYEVLFTASDGGELIVKLNKDKQLPDIVLLDLKMTGMDGIEATQHIKIHFPTIKIIVISSHYKHSFLNFMFKTGASAFVPKGISPVLLKHIIQSVYINSVYFMEDQIACMKEKPAAKPSKYILNNDDDLSEREIEILKLISMQKTANEIGEILHITGRTVEGHKNNLFIKTGAKNIAGLVVFAIQHDIISIDILPRI
ncbi:response regulator transcription factor [Flavobacterium soli]|uniref:response regulator transcription factor n=1 Tax=Flavobacterium soli TaxID=344881 RepID=UPI000422AA3B|nr:response regulator transcription factor [Flavobacterium soli]